jgi:hypothetical protein
MSAIIRLNVKNASYDVTSSAKNNQLFSILIVAQMAKIFLDLYGTRRFMKFCLLVYTYNAM